MKPNYSYVKFGDFVEIQPTVKIDKETNYSFIPMENVTPGLKYVYPTDEKKYEGSGVKFENDDVIFARITPCLEHGKITIARGLTKNKGFGSTEYYIFRAKPGISDKDYIYYLAISPIIRDNAIVSMIGASGRQRAQKDVIENLTIRVPSLLLQKKISLILSAYDDLIDTNRRRIQLLEESARLLFREWFVYFRFPSFAKASEDKPKHEKVKIVDGVPEGWERGEVKGLGNIITGKTPSKSNFRYFNGDVPFIKTPDMRKSSIVINTEEFLSEVGGNSQRNKYLPPWSILISCIGSVGVVAMNFFRSQTNQQINSIIPKKEIYRYYSFFCLSRLQPLLEAIGGGSTMANVNKNKFENLKVLIPSENILNEFHKAVDSIFKQIAIVLQQNQKLAQARDLLLPRLINGDIKV